MARFRFDSRRTPVCRAWPVCPWRGTLAGPLKTKRKRNSQERRKCHSRALGLAQGNGRPRPDLVLIPHEPQCTPSTYAITAC